MKALQLSLATMLTLLVAPAATPADEIRGRMLYERHCGECHNESVHGRRVPLAKNYEEVRWWVRRWNTQLGGYWLEEDIEDVTAYLNTIHYRNPPTEP